MTRRSIGNNLLFMPLELKSTQLIGNEFAILWSDGVESYLRLEHFRRACPCAMCGGEPDVLGNISSRDGGITYTPASFELVGWQIVGGYAIQPRWADGHNTGLYSFQYLRRLSSSTDPA
jgi:DUF971 family protein